jgi:hypothetical protein
MRGLDRPLAAVLVLGAVLCACAQQPPPPTPSPTPTPMYPTTAYITLFEYPIPGGCGVVAIPYHAWVARDGDIVWDVVNEACPSAGDVEIEFAEKDIVELDRESLKNKKKGKVKAKDFKPHKYTVILDKKFKHDPEIEIWP